MPADLFGPADAAFADSFLATGRAAKTVVPFGPGTDVNPPADATWEDVERAAGIRPERLLLWLPYTSVPAWVWSAPISVVGLAHDWNLLWHQYRHQLSLCDAVLTDRSGVETFRRAGLDHVNYANLFGLGREWFDEPWADPAGPREVDVLFVGNFHPAIQTERLPWVGRLAELSNRYTVRIESGVFGTAYRTLLRRAKVVFNRSIRGEANQRAFEATAAGAVLLQEGANGEIRDYFDAETEFVPYTIENLESRIEALLDNNTRRVAIARNGQKRVRAYAFESLIARGLNQLDHEMLRERTARRSGRRTALPLAGRVWQRAGLAGADHDPGLVADLTAAGRDHEVGLLMPDPAAAELRFRSAAAGNRVSALAHAETLLGLGRRDAAVAALRETLRSLADGPPLSPDERDTVPVPRDFGPVRVGWEAAGWRTPGDAEGEAEAKRAILIWRTWSLLADVSGELSAYEAAATARPAEPTASAAYGCALARAGRIGEAVPPLRAAIRTNPFDLAAARALYQVLRDGGDGDAAAAWADSRRRLHRAALRLVPAEPWFASVTEASSDSSDGRLAIEWEGEFDAVASLAVVNRSAATALGARGHALRLRALRPPPGTTTISLDPELAKRVQALLPRPADVHVRHAWPPRFDPPAEGAFVLVQPWEFGALPAAWVEPILETVDEVWAYTAAVRDCYLAAGIPPDRVRLVPLGVDGERFRLGVEPFRLKTRKATRFLFVGGTTTRKGFDVLLDAYGRAFRADDDVCLVVKPMGAGTTYLGQTGESWIAALRSDPCAPEVEVLGGDWPDGTMPGLYAACTCLAHPYRGEGFGLPILEAMACGLPVVVTAGGAADDYCLPEAAYRLPAGREFFPEDRVDQFPTVGRPWLLAPDPAAVVAALRRVAANPEEARAKGRAGHRLARGWTWGHTAAAVEQRVRELRGRTPVRFRTAALPTPITVTSPTPVVGPRRGRPRVSLTMIVKNEEANLPDCLAGLTDLFDEIVVVDTGSTDRTRDVARAHGARLGEFPWVDDFAAARNAALDLATGDYAFWLDADDRLDDVNRNRLRALFGSLDGSNVAYAVKCRCVADRPGATPTVVDHVRLFPVRPDVRWEHRVHEQILPALRRIGTDVRWSDVCVDHVGYVDPAVRRRKLDRDLRILERDLADRPGHPFTLFNLGSVYQELGDYGRALQHLGQSLTGSHPHDSITRKLFALIVQCHRKLGRTADARAAVAEGRSYFPTDAELLFLDGLLAQETRDWPRAEAAFRELLAGSDAAHFASVDGGLRGVKARHNLALVYLDSGRPADAAAEWRAALDLDPAFVPALAGLGEAAIRTEDGDGIEAAARGLDAFDPTHAAMLRARSLLKADRFADARAVLTQALDRAPDDLGLRVLLSHALLRDGSDPAAAERALLAVLDLDPDHAETRHNLQVLRSRHGPADPS